MTDATTDQQLSDTAVTRRLKRSHKTSVIVFLPVLAALLAVWAVAVWFTISERAFALERVTAQLLSTVTTLADFNELAELATGDAIIRGSEHRTAAIWRALLQYPTASIWVESDGEIVGGEPPLATRGDDIAVGEIREAFTVQASMPRADALADWQRAVLQRAAVLTAASAAFLVLTGVLARALQQRSLAEQQALMDRERAIELTRHKAELEETVALRTGQLLEANQMLGKELVERRAAQAELQQHDSLLHAVTKGAAELLSANSLEDAAETVLRMIGQTIGVSRVQIRTIAMNRDGHPESLTRHEWCVPGLAALTGNAASHAFDLLGLFPHLMGSLAAGQQATAFIDELSPEGRAVLEPYELRSMLLIPIEVEGTLWGSLSFVDSNRTRRQWTWAETDTLKTLAGLIGVAITRARYVKDLADANMIVQNSPTILYRLQGEPPFRLIYVSHNIKKFGFDPVELIAASNWQSLVLDEEGQESFATVMERALDKNAPGASVELRMRGGDGTYRWVESRYTPVRDKHGRLVEVEGIIIDITERKAAEEKIAVLARTDALTGLANRATFVERLRHAFASAKRGGASFAILYLDLDHFKQVNDTLGHGTGDALLREVAERLKSCTRESDVVARLGGDEFAVIQADMSEVANAGALAAALQAAVTRPYLLDGNDLHVTTSIGICPFVPSSTSPDAMLAQADLALYRSKDEGRNRYRFHTDDLDKHVLERITLADELRTALERNELDLHYQPQVELASGKIVGMEALVRWHHPTRGLLAAADFLPIAEKTGAIIAVGQWVLNRACSQMRAWCDAGIDPGVLTLNLALAQLKNSRELLKDVAGAIEKWHLRPTDLSFDVTEATLAHVTIMRSDVLAELRRLGVRIAIDDFGSEYSSFDYLKTYRVNRLKIAQPFIDAALQDREHAATVRAIINLAHELGIEVVTQGVETEEQRDLSSETTTLAQGAFFAEPLAAEDAAGLLRRGRIDGAAKRGQHETPLKPVTTRKEASR
jgi:diguanylate cyclase (GGDEF)-like protein/PAS domain S-box-containing protein